MTTSTTKRATISYTNSRKRISSRPSTRGGGIHRAYYRAVVREFAEQYPNDPTIVWHAEAKGRKQIVDHVSPTGQHDDMDEKTYVVDDTRPSEVEDGD